MNPIEFVGIFAGCLTVGGYVPQVLKSHKTKSTSDLSWGYLAMTLTGNVLWIIYGVAVGSLAVIFTNIGAGTLVLSLIFLKRRYG